MVVSEGQKLGALALLTFCLFYYDVSLLPARQPGAGTSIPWGRQEPGKIAVEVKGVRVEGVYFVPKGITIGRLSEIAGIPEGRDGSVDPGRVISDDALLAVSPSGAVIMDDISAAKRLALGLRIDLNLASQEDLSLVPGISDRMAAQIVQWRLEKGGFRDLADLTAVSGIKEKKLNSLKDYLMAGQTP